MTEKPGTATDTNHAKALWKELRGKASEWFATLRDDLEQDSAEPVFMWRWVLIPLAVITGLTVFARLTNFDLGMQELIYQAGDGSWRLGDHPFWYSLYKLGTFPATIVVLLSVLGYIGSWKKQPLRRWRRVFLFLLFCAIVGPGIVTNAGLKEYWGRPRPREVQGLGGHSQFEKILTIDKSSDGKSFPCGHATMGFYFVCGFFLLRRHRKKLAQWFLIGGFLVGAFMGIARMAQGGHFFSDVVWAGAVCYFTAMGLYYLFGLHKGIVRRGLRSGKMPLWLTVSMAAAAVGLVTAILLASPYRGQRNYYILNDFAKEGPLEILLILTIGEIEIRQGEDLHIEGEAYGHGVPTSKIGAHYVEWEREGFSAIWYSERFSGWLAEVNQQLYMDFPWERVRKLKMEAGNTKMWIDLDRIENVATIQFFSGEGEVHLYPRGKVVKLIGGENARIIGELPDDPRAKDVGCRLLVDPEFTGTIYIGDPRESGRTE